MSTDTESADRGIVRQLRDSRLDIAVIRGDGDDVMVKAGGPVLLLEAAEARLLAREIHETLDEPETDQ